MVLNPEFAHNTHQNQHQNLQEDLIQSKHEQLTVNQFIKQTNKSLQLPKFTETKKKSIPLTPEHIQIGSQIRNILNKENNFDELLSIITKISDSRSYHIILEGLQREEITVLITSLVDGQEEKIYQYNDSKITLDLNNKYENMEGLYASSYTISKFYLGLLATNFELSITEIFSLLKLESNNYRYDRAAELIQYLDRKSKSKNSIKTSKYWNYKLKVLGNANPGFWTVLNKDRNKVRLSKRALKQDFEKMLSFGVLMNQLSQEIGYIVPNLETHGLIIASAGRDNQLELVENQILNLWGIGIDNIDSKNLVDSNSLIYPDYNLLKSIIAAFAVNNEFEIAIKYITNFQSVYNIDLSKKLFWKELFNWAEATLSKDDESYKTTMESIWKLMETNSPNFNVVMVQKRSQFLEEQGRLNDLIELILHSKKEISKFYEPLKLEKGKILLKEIYQKICVMTLAETKEESIDLIKLSKTISLDKSSRDQLSEIYKLELSKALENRRRFEQLQEEYDEEDDENSLW
ncbi:hypothetical protein BN7_4855 [Wickerhamomyces ciferrii]|uniref:ATPase expression protein 2, mitochondrial n=1 Tax=Wickerhamomyces ciferrii (strain ATCC 14091 / BCRC 22168 / CBS 111 / JCM 3599 / NBRC 0793 / NRRL Y-1031 F-60-10) TaxID=1206466 RepID=K0KVY3_WICCF|nr:uncharacterized protein BN7_4855 [Wickerhamomyces ciferrii]CCH45273.1 hypothetical protein BN7_4855 [Wickerhamomyces ciferrii]